MNHTEKITPREGPQDYRPRNTVLLTWKAKLGIAAAVIIVLMAALSLLYFHGYQKAEAKYQAIVDDLNAQLDDRAAVYEEVSTEVNLSVVSAEIKTIGQLATVEYLYTDAGKFSDPKQVFGYNIPFTTKSFIAKWDGVIKAGVDVTKIELSLDDEEKTITIYLPQAEILSHEIDENSVETLDESDGLFNPVKVEDVRTFDAESKAAMEQRAIGNGILDKAYANAEEIISSLLHANPAIGEAYRIVFEPLGT